MGLLQRIFGGSPAADSTSPTLRPVLLKGRAEVEVKGEASYQKALEALAGGKGHNGVRLDVTASLRCEPTNKYDPNAVVVAVDGRTVGYLRRDLAAKYCPLLTTMEQRGQQATCEGTIMGGWRRDGGDEGMFGISLTMPSPKVLAAQIDTLG